jgi:hypothetical protein
MCYRSAVSWQPAEVEGFALAATVSRDRRATQALPGVAAGLRPALQARCAALAASAASERRAWVAGLLGAQPAVGSDVPPRARALLATMVDVELGRRWLAEAPLPRAGYTPAPALRRLLARTAALDSEDEGSEPT